MFSISVSISTSFVRILTESRDPWKRGLLNGKVVYTYSYEEIVFRRDNSVDKMGNTLIVEFDEQMKVKNYYFNIPAGEPVDLTLMMHKGYKNKQQQEQVAWQNPAAVKPTE